MRFRTLDRVACNAKELRNLRVRCAEMLANSFCSLNNGEASFTHAYTVDRPGLPSIEERAFRAHITPATEVRCRTLSIVFVARITEIRQVPRSPQG